MTYSSLPTEIYWWTFCEHRLSVLLSLPCSFEIRQKAVAKGLNVYFVVRSVLDCCVSHWRTYIRIVGGTWEVEHCLQVEFEWDELLLGET